MRFLNKNAQVGSTLTWMIAFLIIFFLMLIFVIFSLFVSHYKVFNKNQISVLEHSQGDLETYSYGINFLETPVFYGGKKMNVEEAYLYMLEPLLNENFLKGVGGADLFFGENLESQLNRFDIFYPQEEKFFYYGKLIEKKNLWTEILNKRSEFRDVLEKTFDGKCVLYYIDAPFFEASIDKNGVHDALSSPPEWVLEKYKGASPTIELYSNGQNLPIKFYFNETC